MELNMSSAQTCLNWFEFKCKQCDRLIFMDIPEDWNPYEFRNWDGEFYSGFLDPQDMYDLRHYGC